MKIVQFKRRGNGDIVGGRADGLHGTLPCGAGITKKGQ